MVTIGSRSVAVMRPAMSNAAAPYPSMNAQDVEIVIMAKTTKRTTSDEPARMATALERIARELAVTNQILYSVTIDLSRLRGQHSMFLKVMTTDGDK
jgi:hypothetical protein